MVRGAHSIVLFLHRYKASVGALGIDNWDIFTSLSVVYWQWKGNFHVYSLLVMPMCNELTRNTFSSYNTMIILDKWMCKEYMNFVKMGYWTCI